MGRPGGRTDACVEGMIDMAFLKPSTYWRDSEDDKGDAMRSAGEQIRGLRENDPKVPLLLQMARLEDDKKDQAERIKKLTLMLEAVLGQYDTRASTTGYCCVYCRAKYTRPKVCKTPECLRTKARALIKPKGLQP